MRSRTLRGMWRCARHIFHGWRKVNDILMVNSNCFLEARIPSLLCFLFIYFQSREVLTSASVNIVFILRAQSQTMFCLTVNKKCDYEQPPDKVNTDIRLVVIWYALAATDVRGLSVNFRVKTYLYSIAANSERSQEWGISVASGIGMKLRATIIKKKAAFVCCYMLSLTLIVRNMTRRQWHISLSMNYGIMRDDTGFGRIGSQQRRLTVWIHPTPINASASVQGPAVHYYSWMSVPQWLLPTHHSLCCSGNAYTNLVEHGLMEWWRKVKTYTM